MAKQLLGKDLGDELILPSVMLKSDEPIFLDGHTIQDVEKSLNIKIKVCQMGAENFIKSCLE